MKTIKCSECGREYGESELDMDYSVLFHRLLCHKCGYELEDERQHEIDLWKVRTYWEMVEKYGKE